MLQIKRIMIGDGERGLKFKNRQFERVLAPGVHWIVSVFARVEVRIFDIEQSDYYAGKDASELVNPSGFPARLIRHHLSVLGTDTDRLLHGRTDVDLGRHSLELIQQLGVQGELRSDQGHAIRGNDGDPTVSVRRADVRTRPTGIRCHSA